MVDGPLGEAMGPARFPAVAVLSQGAEHVPILHQPMVELHVLAVTRKQLLAMTNLAPLKTQVYLNIQYILE